MTIRNQLVAEDSIRIERLQLGPYGTNAYLLQCPQTRASALIDAPAEIEILTQALKDSQPQYVLLTHNHADHTGALTAVRSMGIPLGAHPLEGEGLSAPPERLLCHGDQLVIGNIRLKVLHTPGHTMGSLCFLTGNHLLAGDTIFPGGPGRTASPHHFRCIIDSICNQILLLPLSTVIYPGHGEVTTVAQAQAEYQAFAAHPHPDDLCGDVLWTMQSGNNQS